MTGYFILQWTLNGGQKGGPEETPRDSEAGEWPGAGTHRAVELAAFWLPLELRVRFLLGSHSAL